MKKNQLAKAIAFAITGAALTAGSVSTASATSTTMYNLFNANSNGIHENGAAVPCAPCGAGETDGWVWGGIANSIPSGTDTINLLPHQPSTDENDAPGGAGWVGTSAQNKTPFGYTGGAVLHWALEFTGGNGGHTHISNADAIKRYNVSADIDIAQGAWSDAALTGSSGWRHDLDYGLFRSDVDGEVTLEAFAVNGAGTTKDIGFTIFEGMDTSTTSYNHHGAWNADNNTQPGAPNAASLPGGGFNLPASAIVAYSVGGAIPKNLNKITFNAKKGKIYTIVIGGYKNGSWNTTTDGYVLSVAQGDTTVAVAVALHRRWMSLRQLLI